jgi:hypothetical protein
MSRTPPLSFRSIGAPLDVGDAELNQVSDKLGVPTLVKTAQAKASKPAPRGEQEAPEPPAPEAGPTRSTVEKLTTELPAYLHDAMKRKALDNRTTVRHVLMLALKEDGFFIAAADLVPDARRTRLERN